MRKIFIWAVVFTGVVSAQTGPWNNALLMATSSDGTNFGTPSVFQDSSGVPSAIQLSDGTLVCAFQWFPAPMNGPHWDSVAVKFSYDNGASWTQPTQCIFNGLPSGYQRPFDPTLVEVSPGQIRMYFSSSETPPMGLDSTVNTYSAISSDGINYTFEANPRYDVTNDPVIDPACTFFNGSWHYTAPIGAPQDGAHHATSADGLTFTTQADIASDMFHNWTGNLIVDSNQMRFYGSGSTIWWNATSDGVNWDGYTNTSITQGGDPSVVKLTDGTYIMIYVGPPGFTSSVEENQSELMVYPNPVNEILSLSGLEDWNYGYVISDMNGRVLLSNPKAQINLIDVSQLSKGVYILNLYTKEGRRYCKRIIKS